MGKNAKIKSYWARGGDYPLDAFSIREDVFVKEQGKDRSQEFDEIDNSAWHLVAYQDDQPCGTLRLHNAGQKWQLSKLCVLKERRGNHIGEALVNQALETLPVGDDVYLTADESLASYFARYGFRPMENEVMYQRISISRELIEV